MDMDVTEKTITLQRAGDLVIEIDSFEDDENTIEVDLSNTDLEFVVDKLFRVVPIADPNNPKGRLLVLNEDHARQVARGARFILRENLPGDINNVLWSGAINSTGFEVTL